MMKINTLKAVRESYDSRSTLLHIVMWEVKELHDQNQHFDTQTARGKELYDGYQHSYPRHDNTAHRVPRTWELKCEYLRSVTCCAQMLTFRHFKILRRGSRT